jgi:hypothetical protein
MVYSWVRDTASIHQIGPGYLPDGIRIKEPIRVAWLMSGEHIAGGRYFFASRGFDNTAGERRNVISWN